MRSGHFRDTTFAKKTTTELDVTLCADVDENTTKMRVEEFEG